MFQRDPETSGAHIHSSSFQEVSQYFTVWVQFRREKAISRDLKTRACDPHADTATRHGRVFAVAIAAGSRCSRKKPTMVFFRESGQNREGRRGRKIAPIGKNSPRCSEARGRSHEHGPFVSISR
jgi:hypothetical protein